MMTADRSGPPSPLPSEACLPAVARSAEAGSATDGSAQADEALRRLRWRARRGLLENDLLIGRFLERQADRLNAAEVAALALLLEQPDAVLLDLLLGRRPPAAELDVPAVRDLLARLAADRAPGRPGTGDTR